MTNSNAIHSTITKQPKPTKFSDLEPKAASKDEFLKSLPVGNCVRMRKRKSLSCLLMLTP